MHDGRIPLHDFLNYFGDRIMYCKTSNPVNKTIHYLNKSYNILKEYGIFDRFKIEKIGSTTHVTGDGETIDYEVVTYRVDGEDERLWLEKTEYEESSRYPIDIRNTIFFLLAMHSKKYYSENLFKSDNFSFSKEEIEIMTLAGNFFYIDAFLLHKGSDNHVGIPNMKLFSRNECYELSYMINLPRFSIGEYLPSFKIISHSSGVALMAIEPKEMVGVESNDPLVDYPNPYILHLSFGEGIDEDNLNEERMGRLLIVLDNKVISTNTNLRDLYFDAGQYLRIANIKEEKLVSIIVEDKGSTTRYLGGLYSGFSMNVAKIDSREVLIPFPLIDVTIGGQKVTLACSMSEIETALGLN